MPFTILLFVISSLYIGNKLLDSLSARDVDLYRTYRMKRVSPVTVNIELRMLRAAFYTAVGWNLLKENPFRRFSQARVPEQQPTYFSKEDFQRLAKLFSCSTEYSLGLHRGFWLDVFAPTVSKHQRTM